jgi:hypothetical protein
VAKDDRTAKRPALPAWKRLLFALVPLLLLAGVLEGVARVAGWDRPSLHSVPLPEERVGLIEPHPTRFWSLRPETHAVWENTRISVNRQGTRGEDVPDRQPGDLRILSLGESSTFGSGVSDEETYSARLEAILRAALPERRPTVVNAGVPAYSSFQSLVFFEERGAEFQPDIVLFYHEVNDYLPTSLRDSSNNEIGVLKTDRELSESRVQRSHRSLLRWSAVYRSIAYGLANARVRRFDRPDAANPLVTIGLPGYALPPRLRPADEAGGRAAPQHDTALGRRVSDAERRANLERLVELSAARGVRLVLLHPSYRDSSRHECLLTRFAVERGVLMFETFDALHPPNADPRAEFKDAWHPLPGGHDRLARGLALFLAEHVLARK